MNLSNTEPHLSPFFRAVATACLVLFAAWLILPSCACQLNALLGGEVAASGSLSGQPVAGDDLSGFADCHCHSELPKTFEGGEDAALPKRPSDELASSFSSALEPNFVSLAATAQSSRGPPPSCHYLGQAEGRAYLAFCVFLL